jgi:hypothetical protein
MMMLDLLRLLLGVSIAVFHRPIAVTIMEQERALDKYLRDRGIHLPAPLRDDAAQNLYFCLGIFVTLFQAARIWLTFGS